MVVRMSASHTVRGCVCMCVYVCVCLFAHVCLFINYPRFLRFTSSAEEEVTMTRKRYHNPTAFYINYNL